MIDDRSPPSCGAETTSSLRFELYTDRFNVSGARVEIQFVVTTKSLKVFYLRAATDAASAAEDTGAELNRTVSKKKMLRHVHSHFLSVLFKIKQLPLG